MNAISLVVGIQKVQISDKLGTVVFNLSVVSVYGVLAVAGFQEGEKPPKKGKHLMLTENVRSWIQQMKSV